MPKLKERLSILLRCRADIGSEQIACVRLDADDGIWKSTDHGFSGDLAALCAMLSFSAEEKELLRNNLCKAGFDRISLEALDNIDPARIGIAFAARRLKGAVLIAAVLRGTQGAEWFSNFRIGYAAEHKGFAIAADYAEGRLAEYLRTAVNDGEVRFLVTGYSRGGAAANLLARRLCDRFGTDRVRCYTVASPNTVIARRSASYDCIHNLVREEDFFTRVPLSDWGYTKYGNIVVLGGDIRESYREISGDAYISFTDKSAVEAVIKAISTLAPNVPAYYKRRHPVGERALSLYDYMLHVAEILSDQADENTGEVIFDSMVSEFSDLSAFLSSGMDVSALLAPAEGIPRCSVADSHSPAAYLGAMQNAGLLRCM